jgi:hypothetical protein
MITKGSMALGGGCSGEAAQRWQRLELIRHQRDPLDAIGQLLAQGHGGHLGGNERGGIADRSKKELAACSWMQGAGFEGLHIRQIVVHHPEAGPTQLAALVDKPKHLHFNVMLSGSRSTARTAPSCWRAWEHAP